MLVHLVEKGDTLYNISKRYGITVAQLIEWNNIQDNVVKLGTYLKVK
ncbi:MAG TPA: LysM peptidoglycan-binding domain-containing protein [Chitinophagales bacterium]|nr:LysM peptidoglycan-binding domain-containing protein [Chitinophagales bacterium]